DRFVHAVAERTPNGIARAGIYDIGIGRRHLYRADAVDVGELIEDREPCHAGASGFPNAADGRPDVEHARLTDRAGDGRDAPTVKRADVAPTETGNEVVARSHIGLTTIALCIFWTLSVNRCRKQRDSEPLNDRQH